MLHIFTALYCEAHIFIKQFRLIKNQENTSFQEFYNEAADVRLTITGVGELAAAAAVGSAYTAYKPTPKDFLLNVGICAHATKKDGIFLCNKIIEKETGKTFYPDMLYRHNFREETIVTGMLPWRNNNDRIIMIPAQSPSKALYDSAVISEQSSCETLYDMEAAAIYQTGIRFLGPHQMLFLKIISDNGVLNGTADNISKDVSSRQVIQLMENYQDCIFEYIGQLSAIGQEQKHGNYHLHSEDETLLETFCTDLHCSKAMRDSMQQYIRYLSLSDIDYKTMIQEMYQKGLLPCKDKREGKRRFEEFKQRLF